MSAATRLFGPVKVEQSGVLPFRLGEDGVEVLLVTSRTKGRWIVPKGTIEKELGARESARREAFEEGGVAGRMADEPIGCYRHGGSKKGTVVEIYLMHVNEVQDDWPEREARERWWGGIEEAVERVEMEGLQELILEARALLRISGGSGAGIHPAVPPAD